MEQTALILIIVTLLLLVIIIGLLAMLLIKMFQQKNGAFSNLAPQIQTGEAPHPEVSKKDFHPAIVERLKEIEKVKPKRLELFCPNHPDEPGETMCAICDKIYCKSCIKSFKTLYYCKEHLPLVMRFDWEEVLTLKTSTHDPEQGVELYDLKREVFENENLPTYVETHYKINVDHDFIETYLVLFAKKNELDKAKAKFQQFVS